MDITIRNGEKVRNFSLKNPLTGKVTKLKNAVKTVFKKSKGIKKPKVDEIIVSTLKSMNQRIDELATKIENNDK
jgi:hypothetical protein